MEISKKITKLYQTGGAMDAPGDAPVDAPVADPAMDPAAEQADPLMQLAELAAQALQTGDCNAAMGLAEAFLGLIQGGAPAPETAGEPVFKKGGKLVKRLK